MKRKIFTLALAALTLGLLGSCSKINGRIDNLDKRVSDIESSEPADMIQTVTIVPAYKDGGVEAVDDTVTIDFMVSPAALVAAIEKENISVLVNEVKTKAVSDRTASIIEFSKDATKGTVSIKANLKEFVPAEAGKSLTVAVNIASGASNYTTEFVPVALTNTIHDVLPGAFSVSAVQKVKFLRGNLWYKSSENSWHIEDKQYYTENEGYGETTTIKDVTFWNYYDREHLIAFYFPSSVQNSNYGTKDLRSIGRDTSNDVLHSNFGFPSEDYHYVDKIEWGEVYGRGHTLSYAEWGYLCSVDATHNMINGIDYSNGVRAGRNRDNVTVVGCKGLLLVPDDWDLTENPLVDTYTKEQWAVAEAEGAVFLPYVMGDIVSGKIDCGKASSMFIFLCGDSYTDKDGDIEFGIYTNAGFKDEKSGLYTFYEGLGSSVRLVVYTEE